MTRRRGLTPEDDALWRLAMRDVAPLPVRRRRPVAARTPAPDAPPAPSPTRQPTPPVPQIVPVAVPPRPPGPPPLAPIDRHERRAVQRGTRPLDGRIDLHGLTQDQALGALRAYLARAQADGRRLVLVITGKGGRVDAEAGPFAGRGVLRRLVPHWLAAPDLRAFVVGFEPAHPNHGGSGALYVRLRRPQHGEGR